MTSSPHTLICFALKEEAAEFQKVALGKQGIAILWTGVGKANAEKIARPFLNDAGLKLVLTCGFAGGLDPALKIGDVVFSTPDETLKSKLIGAGAKPAKFFCASKVAITVAEKQELRKTTGADVVDMESEVIQDIARERGIACATVRAISDTANEDLPLDFNKLAKPDMSPDMGKIAIEVLKNPAKVPALMRLQKNCQLAAERLAEVLNKLV